MEENGDHFYPRDLKFFSYKPLSFLDPKRKMYLE